MCVGGYGVTEGRDERGVILDGSRRLGFGSLAVCRVYILGGGW